MTNDDRVPPEPAKNRRRAFWRIASAVSAALCLYPVAPPAAAVAQEVRSVRFGVDGDRTRLVLDLSAPVEARIFTLPDPYRVVIDLPEIRWTAPARAGRERMGPVAGWRAGLFRPGTHRLVLDLHRPTRVKSQFTLSDPPRLVLDLERTDRARFMAESRASLAAYNAHRPRTDTAPGSPPSSPRARQPGKRVIVLDPGHGGNDPGAIGVGNVHEADITLLAARDVRSALEKTGRYRVAMTRDRDIFVKLRRRVDIARRHDADLFVSLHVDSLTDRNHRGASVYTLSEEASDREAARLAARENKADTIAGLDLEPEPTIVQSILIDLAQRETMNSSARFANILLGEMAPDIKLQRRNHRFAGFAVLKAPDVPSVLLEMGYLSNSTDAGLLQKTAHRRKLARAIVRAIDRYFVDRRVALQ